MTPLLGWPTLCPALPRRCTAEATVKGLCTRITLSRAPMSIPSSRELVATMAFSSPFFSRCSTTRRSSREREP